MNWQDKFIPWLLMAQATMAAVSLIWQGTVAGLSVGTSVVAVLLISSALVAGIGALKRLRWARMLIVAVYAVQIVSYVSPTFAFDLWLGFHFKLSFGWFGGGRVGVNLLALGMTAWAGSHWFPYAPARAA